MTSEVKQESVTNSVDAFVLLTEVQTDLNKQIEEMNCVVSDSLKPIVLPFPNAADLAKMEPDKQHSILKSYVALYGKNLHLYTKRFSTVQKSLGKVRSTIRIMSKRIRTIISKHKSLNKK